MVYCSHNHLLIKDQIHYTNTFSSSIRCFIAYNRSFPNHLRFYKEKKSEQHKVKTTAGKSLKNIEKNAQITEIDIILRYNTYLSLLISSYSALLVPHLVQKTDLSSAYQQQYNNFFSNRISKSGRPIGQ